VISNFKFQISNFIFNAKAQRRKGAKLFKVKKAK